MRFILMLLVTVAIICVPATAGASEFMSINLAFSRAEDGTTSGELLFNNKVVWRLQVLTDGARPVSSIKGGNTTMISPDIINGLFLIKVHHASE